MWHAASLPTGRKRPRPLYHPALPGIGGTSLALDSTPPAPGANRVARSTPLPDLPLPVPDCPAFPPRTEPQTCTSQGHPPSWVSPTIDAAREGTAVPHLAVPHTKGANARWISTPFPARFNSRLLTVDPLAKNLKRAQRAAKSSEPLSRHGFAGQILMRSAERFSNARWQSPRSLAMSESPGWMRTGKTQCLYMA